jgi:hypothetical protein
VKIPEKRNAGPLAGTGAANANHLLITTTAATPTTMSAGRCERTAPAADRQPIVTVSAFAYPPCARRRLWLLLVTSCPYCASVHAHRGAQHGGVRRAGCDRGEYSLQTRVARRWTGRAA